jgi:hypothetical protein
LIEGFTQRKLLLETVTQWPMTLPAFFQLHPVERDLPVRRFEMGLSPISTGLAMIPDSAPHFVSMLRDLCGDGEVLEPRAQLLPEESGAGTAASFRRVELSCRYEHGRGATESVLHLRTCAERPRPAWYAVNGSRVDRHIELPTYQQFFICGDRRVQIEDPLGLLVARFLDGVQEGRETDAAALRRDQGNVECLCQALL